jgi:hypothetical protein
MRERGRRRGDHPCRALQRIATKVISIVHQGDIMPTVIAHHDITKGKAHWLSSPKRKELFGSLGVTHIRTFVDTQNPNHVAIMMDVPNMDAVMEMMKTQAAADAMAQDGVVPDSLVILVEES